MRHSKATYEEPIHLDELNRARRRGQRGGRAGRRAAARPQRDGAPLEELAGLAAGGRRAGGRPA